MTSPSNSDTPVTPDNLLNTDTVPEHATACIIAGSRSATDHLSPDGLQRFINTAIETADFTPDIVVSGTARGVDQAGERWATDNNIPVAQFPADWDEHGRAAGPIRNERMAQYADSHTGRGVLLAILDYPSNGTESMIQHARNYLGDTNVYVVPLGEITSDTAQDELGPVLHHP